MNDVILYSHFTHEDIGSDETFFRCLAIIKRWCFYTLGGGQENNFLQLSKEIKINLKNIV